MMFPLFVLYIFGYCHKSLGAFVVDDSARPQVTYLEPSTIVDYQPKTRRGFFDKEMRIYCYRGSSKKLINFFESVELQLEIERDEFTQYEGATPTEVRQHFDERQSLFSFNLFTQKRTRLHLPPFNQQCIGIDTELSYRVRLHQSRVDYFRLVQFGVGVSVFLFSGKLSHNKMFYYLTGIVLGICCSFMLLIWLSSKLMPRRPLMYGMMLGGWTLGFYIIQRLWENLHVIFQIYRTYVVWYIFISGVVAFFFCYRIGPPKNQRSKNIIKWVLQIMAITLIYFASHYQEASATAAVITSLIHFFPHYILHKFRSAYRRFFPKQRRLLTMEEYHEQSIIETAKALNDLRAYASSPDCKQWKIISKLSDPLRFASFVEGDSHLRDEETAAFESFIQTNTIDDSDFSENGDENMLENSQKSNACYFKYDQILSPKAKKNVTNAKMSEDENASEDSFGNNDIQRQPETFNAITKNNVKHIGKQHIYLPVEKVKSLPARKYQQNRTDQRASSTAETNKKYLSRFHYDYLNKKSYYNNGSESDEY
ncbi:nuclear envelope integral membrane protein [Eurosta solidaginis]|uniref:nuclear envelope integral membrane protein n=1 Tax=Eurosta solidaginis TaxID=178769 RepID=UPI003531538A